MAYFTSHRERRLWFWTLAVMVAIYATMGLAQTLSEMLGNQNLAALLFMVAMVLVGAAVVAQGLRARPGGVEIAVALGVFAAYFLVFARMAFATERSHMIEYGVVAVFIHEALTERVSNGRRVPIPALLAILATSLLGAVDEVIQAFVPSRVFDPQDILFNVLAATMAMGASAALAWARPRVAGPTG